MSTPLGHMSTGAVVDVFVREMQFRVENASSRTAQSIIGDELFRTRLKLSGLQKQLRDAAEKEYEK